MVGIRLIIIMAIVGGLIAYLADKMGSKIGKKECRYLACVQSIRPYYLRYSAVLLLLF